MNNFLVQKFSCSPSSALAIIISPLPVSEIFILPSTVNLESLKTLRVPPSGLKPSTDTTSYTEVCVCVCVSVSSSVLFAALWTMAHLVPLSMEFSRQQYWSGLPFCSSGNLLNPEIKPRSLTLQADSLPSEPPGKSIPKPGFLIVAFSITVCFHEGTDCFRIMESV